MVPVISANALLVWFVWGFFMAMGGRSVLGSWGGCWEWSGASEPDTLNRTKLVDFRHG